MRVCAYVDALHVYVGHVSLCVLYVLHTFGVCVHVLGWVSLSPTHSSAVSADWLPSCAPAACSLWQWSTQSFVHVAKWSKAELSLPHGRVELTVEH